MIEQSFWEMAIDRAEQAKIRQERRKALTNPDNKINHNDEYKDAKQGNYVKIDARIVKTHRDEVAKSLKRRELIGKGKR